MIPAHHFQHERIEPTLTGKSDPNRVVNTTDNSHAKAEFNQTQQNTTWEHQLGDWFKNNQKVTLLVSSIIIVVVISLISLSVFDETPELVKGVTEQPLIEQQKKRNNKIEMPDSFWVMLDQYDALTIGWQGDYRKDGEIWSAITAQGDKDCFEINFTIRDQYRAMKVTVKNQGDYYADFSPIDTKRLIQSIANRDKFKLCGYEFSLKGTQAKLRNNKKTWVD